MPRTFCLILVSAVMVSLLAVLSPSHRTMLSGAVVYVESVGPRRAGAGCGDVGVRGCERGVSLSNTLLPSLGKALGG